jgi:hypothetical protein
MNSFVKLGIVVATANLLAVAGFAGWLAATGRLDRERIDRVRELFAKPVADEAKEKQDALSKADEAALAEDAMRKLRELPMASAERADSTARTEERIELGLRTFKDSTERMRDGLRNAEKSLDEQIRDFEKRKTAWEESIASDKQRATDEQFRKAVRLVESLPPKQARSWILELVNTHKTDTAVAYLDAMSGAKASNLLKSFKGDEETKVATELLERLRMLGLESEARAERPNAVKPADNPVDSARSPSRGSLGPASRADAGTGPASNRSLELPGAAAKRPSQEQGGGQPGARANADK